MSLAALNDQLARDVGLGKIPGLTVSGKRKYGIWVDTGQRWIRLGQRDLNPPIDCHEQLHIAWYIQVRYGDVSPEWLIEHAQE